MCARVELRVPPTPTPLSSGAKPRGASYVVMKPREPELRRAAGTNLPGVLTQLSPADPRCSAVLSDRARPAVLSAKTTPPLYSMAIQAPPLPMPPMSMALTAPMLPPPPVSTSSLPSVSEMAVDYHPTPPLHRLITPRELARLDELLVFTSASMQTPATPAAPAVTAATRKARAKRGASPLVALRRKRAVHAEVGFHAFA